MLHPYNPDARQPLSARSLLLQLLLHPFPSGGWSYDHPTPAPPKNSSPISFPSLEGDCQTTPFRLITATNTPKTLAPQKAAYNHNTSLPRRVANGHPTPAPPKNLVPPKDSVPEKYRGRDLNPRPPCTYCLDHKDHHSAILFHSDVI